jgi:hypothetical protein
MKAHDLARKLLEGPDKTVYTNDIEQGPIEVQGAYVDAWGEVRLAIYEDMPTPQELVAERAAKERADRIREEYRQRVADRERELYERYGHLLP